MMTGTRDPEKAWADISGRYPGLSLVVTLGKRGSVAFSREEGGTKIIRQEALKVQAVDTTAAGDTFTGYFVAGLVLGEPLRVCLAQAARAAAISVTRPGAADSIPWREELKPVKGDDKVC